MTTHMSIKNRNSKRKQIYTIHKFIISINTNIYYVSPHPWVWKRDALLITLSYGAEEVVGELDHHVIMRNIWTKVKMSQNDWIQIHELQ
jgi:hypothetical protein